MSAVAPQPESNAPSSIAFTLSHRTLYGIIGVLGFILVLGGGCFLRDVGKDTVEVDQFLPSGEVQPGTNFTVTFTKDLVPDSLVNQRTSEGPVVFEPPLPGQFQWIAPNRVRFYPNVVLAPSSSYTATVQDNAARKAGYALNGETAFTFNTPRIRVTSAALNFEFVTDRNTEANVVSSVAFNYPVAPEVAARHIALRYKDGASIPYEIQTTAPAPVIDLTATGVARGADEREIELSVEPGLQPLAGNLGTERRFTQPIFLPGQEDLKVYTVKAVRESPESGVIRMNFNIPIHLQDARSSIIIEPVTDFRVTSSHQTLTLRGDFKADQSYKVTLKKGLRAIDGTQLDQRYATTVTFLKEDIPPQIDFVGDGFYLTRSGNLNLGLSTINVDEVLVEVEKVFANNLVPLLNATTLVPNENYYDNESDQYYYYNEYLNLPALGQSVHQFDLGVESVSNDEIVTPLSVADYLQGERLGLYRVVAREKERRWHNASRWIVATDMGMFAKQAGNDLWVWVHSLSSLAPVAGAELQVLSQNNQTLMTGTTDADGLAVFRAIDEQNEGFRPYVVTATRGEDLSFLELTRRRIPTSDFDVGGSAYLKQGFDAFLYDERGIYRPGETVHLAAIVRAENTTVPPSFPLKLRVTGPDGRILNEQRTTLTDQGAATFDVDVPTEARTGRYTASLLIGDAEEIGRGRFSVEEFIPDRMKVSLNTAEDEYHAGETIQIDVEGMTLFGPPAAGRRVDTNVEVEAFPFTPENWKNFSFTDHTKTFSKQRYDLEPATLDDQGRHRYSYTIPKGARPPSALRGVISSTVLEPGGRGVTAYRGILIHPNDTYVGLRKDEGYAEPGRPVDIEYVVVDPNGQVQANHRLDVTLHHIYWHTILKEVNGRYRYTSERIEDEVARQRVTSQNEATTFQVIPEEYGSYRVQVRDEQTGASASLSFYASGWGYAPWAMDTPGRVDLDLDQEIYAPGEQAKVQIRAPFGGKVLLTVERDQVLHHQLVTMESNTATVDLPITEAYQPNAYVSALLVRSTDGLERNMPARAFGAVPLMVDNTPRQLAVSFNAPDEVRPQGPLTVDFQVEGNRQDRPYVTVAAVDEGILQLNDFQSPDPFAHFYGKKQLSVDTYDMHGALLPEVMPTLLSTGGDVETSRKRQLSPQTARRVKPVAFWSGLVQTDGRGRGQVTFDVPEFNGTLRLMAVAFDGDRFGMGEEDVLVRDPVVLTPTFPRFMTTQDRMRVPVSVFNGTGRDATFEVALAEDGPVEIVGDATQQVQVARDREEVVYFEVQSGKTLGEVDFRITANGGGAQTGASTEVPIRPPAPFATLSGSGSVQDGDAGALTLPAQFVPGTAAFELVVSSFPAVQFSGSLQHLLQYPHGCVEQTTSKVFPLLAFGPVAQVVEPDLFAQNSADYYITEGIAKLERMQQPSGAFSYWPGGGRTNNWGSIYAAHFLVEARKTGYQVADRVYNRLLGALRTFTRAHRGDDTYDYQSVVYAAYVLALAGDPDRSTMNYIKNNKLDRLSVYSQYQLAGSYAQAGDRRTALSLLPQTVQPSVTRETGGHFNSPLRAQAIMLDVLSEVDATHGNVPILVQNLTEALSRNRRFSTTQENAFAFLALGKVLRQQGPGDYTGTLLVNGQAMGQFDEGHHRFTGTDWAGKRVELNIQGSGTAYYYWRADGILSGQATPEFDRDLVVRRRYLRENGSPYTDYSQFKQGDLVIAEITLDAPTTNLKNVAVVDLLPAGLEIENPRLESRQGVTWMKNSYSPEYLDIRDDRMIIYGHVNQGKTQKFYYGLRAVTAGTFVLPPIRGEAMYDPRKASVASSGQLTVQGL